MATDEVMYDSSRNCSGWDLNTPPLRTSNYARIGDRGKIYVRGSAYANGDTWTNPFSPNEARRLARYILELADDAEKDPAVEELASALSHSASFSVDYYEQAQALIAEGYRK